MNNMKQNILFFIIGVTVTLCVAMSPQGRSIVLTEPVVPTDVKIINVTLELGDHREQVSEVLRPYIKKGYVVKLITARHQFSVIVVLEKY